MLGLVTRGEGEKERRGELELAGSGGESARCVSGEASW